MDSEFFRPPGLERSRAWHSNKWKNKKEGKRNISADQIQRKGRLGLAAWPTNRKTYGLLSKEDGDPFLDEMISTRKREREKKSAASSPKYLPQFQIQIRGNANPSIFT